MIENENLIERIGETQLAWDRLTPLVQSAYNVLLEEADDFWEPTPRHNYSRPPWWMPLGQA
jgi:hypothetical protein